MTERLTKQAVDEVAKKIEHLFPKDEDDPEAKIAVDVLPLGWGHNYECGEIRRGRFVLRITDNLFGDDRKYILEALEELNFQEEIVQYEKLILAGPTGMPSTMNCSPPWDGTFRLCRDS